MAKKQKPPEIKKPTTRRTIRIRITHKELIDARDLRDPGIEHPRELVAEKFYEQGFVVADFAALLYFNKPWGWYVEGDTLKSLIRK